MQTVFVALSENRALKIQYYLRPDQNKEAFEKYRKQKKEGEPDTLYGHYVIYDMEILGPMWNKTVNTRLIYRDWKDISDRVERITTTAIAMTEEDCVEFFYS